MLLSGTVGQIAIARPDPVMLLGYWNDEEATARKIAGDWLLTGDLGRQDEDGYITFSAATTTSSPHPATASARPRSRTA